MHKRVHQEEAPDLSDQTESTERRNGTRPPPGDGPTGAEAPALESRLPTSLSHVRDDGGEWVGRQAPRPGTSAASRSTAGCKGAGRPTCVLVMADAASEAPALRAGLERAGLRLVGESSDAAIGAHLARVAGADSVIVDFRTLSTDAVFEVHALRAEWVAPVLLYGVPDDGESIELALQVGPAAHLPRSCPVEDFGPGIAFALHGWRELCRIERERTRTKRRLDERVVIEQAKDALVEAKPGLTPAAAFRQMQKTSMETRKGLGEVASAILLARQAQSGGPDP